MTVFFMEVVSSQAEGSNAGPEDIRLVTDIYKYTLIGGIQMA